MADHLVAILGEFLFTGPVDRDRNQLPSPEELKRKILIKGKKLRPRGVPGGCGGGGSGGSSAGLTSRHFECPETVDEETDGTGCSTPEIGNRAKANFTQGL